MTAMAQPPPDSSLVFDVGTPTKIPDKCGFTESGALNAYIASAPPKINNVMPINTKCF
jgi:hypothetical protein